MTDLRRLFDDPGARDAAEDDQRAKSVDVATIVGPRSPAGRERRVQRDVQALASMVGGRGAIHDTPSAGWRAPESAVAGKRPSNFLIASGRVSVLSVIVAILAVVAVIAAVSLGVYRQVTADPLDGAMSSLIEAEAEVQNDIRAVATASGLLTQTTATAESLITQFEGVLPALDGKVDVDTLSAARDAQAVLSSTVSSLATPTSPAYSRGEIDLTSLEEVARATDRARALRAEVPGVLAEVRANRAVLVQAIDGLELRLDALAQRITQDLPGELSRNTAASRTARDAVGAAAAAVAQARGVQLAVPLTSYADAVTNLRNENDRFGRTSGSRGEVTTRYAPASPPSPGPTAAPEASPPATEPSPSPIEPAPEASGNTGDG